jgi:outer membrane biosynthesis protein TonB
MNAHKKSPGDKALNGKKSKKDREERKAKAKDKTVAAEMAAPTMREEAAKPAPSPAPAQANPARTEAKAPKPAFAAKPPVKPEAKPVPEPAVRPAAKPAQRPEPKPASEAKLREHAAAGPREAALSTAETMERSLKAARAATLAVNRTLIDFAKENMNCSLDLVKDVAAARNPMRVMRLHMEYWHDCLANFASQAEALRALSAEFVANANEPIREHMRKSRGPQLNRH